MLSSSVRTFTDPDEYAAAVRQGTVQLTVTQRGIFRAKLTRIDLHHLWMQRFSDNLPRTTHVDGWGGRAIIVFRTQPGPSLTRNSVELDWSSISRPRPGQSYYHRTAGSASYGSVSLPLEEMVSLGAALSGCDLTSPIDAVTVTPPPERMAKLRRLHEAAANLVEDAPDVLAHHEAARGLEQALIGAMMDCLGAGETREDKAAARQHSAIMRRFHRAIEQCVGQPLYLPELCKAIGASERTLRACCQEHLGMGPKHYLLLRRMHLVRRALRESAAADTTVTEIATRYGFWQFGRLAVEYKTLFGEPPSATLAHPVR
jgi:AraC-like DNA-binding protein